MVTSGSKVVFRLWNQFQTSDTFTRKVGQGHQKTIDFCTGSLVGIRRTMTWVENGSSVCPDFAALSERRFCRQIVYSHLAETILHA
ncbi:hypothetical protein TNCV_122331 [Trichonephila clavipes]|nr:hypothetical protein TNCV_122331 [Trichonephila clavipes]